MESSSELVTLPMPDFEPSPVLSLSLDESTDLLAVLHPEELQIVRLSSFQLIRSLPVEKSKVPLKVFWAMNQSVIIVFAASEVEVRSLREEGRSASVMVDCDGVFSASYGSGVEDEESVEYLAVCGTKGSLSVLRNESQDSSDFRLFRLKHFATSSHVLSSFVDVGGRRLFAGFSSGELRCSDLSRGDLQWTSALGKGVRSLFKLDGCVAAGLSSGAVTLIDEKHGSIIATFRQSRAAVTAMAGESRRLFYSGADSRIFVVESTDKGWQLRDKTRGQSHDVNALLYSQKHSVLLSAGVNTDVCYILMDSEGSPQSETAKKRHETHVPQGLVFHCSKGVVGIAHAGKLRVFKFSESNEISQIFELRTREALYAATIDEACELLVVSSYSARQTRIYELSSGKNLFVINQAPSKLLFHGNSLIFFDSKQKKLCFASSKSGFNVQKSIGHPALERFNHVDLLSLSSDGSRLMVADLINKELIVVSLKKGTIFELSHLTKHDRYFQFSFTSNPNEILMINSSLAALTFHYGQNQLSRKTKLCPLKFKPVLSLIPHPRIPSKVLLHSAEHLILADYTESEKTEILKRKTVLFVGRLNENKLISVEVDWKLASSKLLPKPVFTKKFIA